MKTNKLAYIVLSAWLCVGCNDFLDTESYTKKNVSNFPATVEDADQMVTGIYSCLNKFSEDPSSGFYIAPELASDDCFGGGSTGRSDNQAYDHLMRVKDTQQDNLWATCYMGIYRANLALENLDRVKGWETEEAADRAKAEVYFLRAYFYFTLSQMFGEVPLVLSTVAQNLPKSPAYETYAQIASDLRMAISLFPSERYDAVASGHATKWAAEALQARVFLFYTGYYEKDTLPLTDGGKVTKEEVIADLEDCIEHSGHDLESDFRNLWPYSNVETAKDYSYARENSLSWAGDGNKETVFAIKFSNLADWNVTTGYANNFCLYRGLTSPNGGESSYPFGQGWGVGPVNPQLWTEWEAEEPNDLRREASILDISKELPDFNPESFRNWMEATGYWQKKYVPINAHDLNGNAVLYSSLLFGTKNDFQLGNTQDLVIIRFADVLLMHSELTETNNGMTRVRNRAGLPEIPYSLAALKKERRYELAFEGLRWFDLMRWHDAADALEKQVGAPIIALEKPAAMKDFGVGYRKRYEQTGGFWQIPKVQIDLSNGVLEQNAGWTTQDCEYMGW